MVKKLVSLALLICALGISSCATDPGKRVIPLTPDLDATLQEVLSHPLTIQPKPVTSKYGSSRNLRYGRFCGASWPDIPNSDEESVKPIRGDSEKLNALISRYYELTPVDNLDKACRNHDVCWILNGRGSAECNARLGKEVDKVVMIWSAKTPGQKACTALALDTGEAASLMPQDSSENATRIAAKISRFNPLHLIYVALWATGKPFQEYPSEEQIGQCNGPLAFDPGTLSIP